MKQDVLGQALLDYQNGKYSEDIKTYSSLDEEDTLPLPYLFRRYEEMPLLEQKALQLCKGSVLDIGCGAGSHSLYLQEKGMNTTCLDQSPGAIQVCKQRGINTTVLIYILDFNGGPFDTLLLLMNGIGIAGELSGLGIFLMKLKSLLKPNGQILIDSSDIIYMFESDADGGHWIPDEKAYYGEVTFSMEYKNIKSEPFNWLYVDFNTLKRAATYHNLNCELVMEGEHYDYLARLTHI
ncbi:class I SAM-dependent methyltransferase [Maribacter sp. CXY002]|uniref:class I SAM-dependent methyltransferase n=1 Tax=Maribacter luteocoastalis TaxID=3407671 RepID=UPI003B68364F